MPRDLLSIGSFAGRRRFSVKALRHCGELGLLEPAQVDLSTGYRCYDRRQAPAAIAIALLRSLDVPLATIRELLASEDPDAVTPGREARERRERRAVRPPAHRSDHARSHRPAPAAERLSRRILRGVRERREQGRAALAFDVAATATGVSRVRPGTGAVEAPTRKARDHAEHAREELAEYLEGLRSYFTVPVDVGAAGAFQRYGIDAAASIPFGEVRSYRWIADEIGRPRAVRAVGTALGRNPVPILVPCHRVLRTDGALGGYAFGLELKQRLLGLERETFAIIGSATAKIACRHGCKGARRIREENRIAFGSLREAKTQGYRACKLCWE